VTIEDLLKGRKEQTHRESDRERVLRLRWPFASRETEVAAEDAILGLDGDAPVEAVEDEGATV
jgi:hypothetical protein